MLRAILISSLLWSATVQPTAALELEGVLEVPFLEPNSTSGGHVAATDDLLVVAGNWGIPGLAFFTRDPAGVAGWSLDQVLPVEGFSAVAIAGSTVVRGEAGPILALYEVGQAGWERVGAIPVKSPAQYLGRRIVADAGRIVALAGEYPSGIELLSFKRDAATSSGWELEARQLLAGYHSPQALALDGDRLGLAASVLGARRRAEIFEWAGGQWRSSLIREDSTVGGIDFFGDLVAIGLPFESTPPTLGGIELYRRGAGGWLLEAVLTAAVEADGFAPRIGEHLVFARSGDLLVASDEPSGCIPDDPTCFPVLRDVRMMQFTGPGWRLRSLWQGQADGEPVQPGPDGWVGRSMVASRDQVIATTTDADRPGLRVFRIGQPSPLEVPALGRPASAAMVLLILAAVLAQLRARRRSAR